MPKIPNANLRPPKPKIIQKTKGNNLLSRGHSRNKSLNHAQSQMINGTAETDIKFSMQSSTLLDELNKTNQSKLDKTLKKTKKKKKKNLARFLVRYYLELLDYSFMFVKKFIISDV